jgi:hypothetical protein
MRMPFGRYKGTDLQALPEEYVRWLNALPALREPLRSAVQTELDHRTWADRFRRRWEAQGAQAQGPISGRPPVDRPTAQAIIDTGYRSLAAKAHPDVGGDPADMVRLNLARDWLRGVLRTALPEETTS